MAKIERIDLNGDGLIQLNEFMEGYQWLLAQEQDEEDYKAIFSMLDRVCTLWFGVFRSEADVGRIMMATSRLTNFVAWQLPQSRGYPRFTLRTSLNTLLFNMMEKCPSLSSRISWLPTRCAACKTILTFVDSRMENIDRFSSYICLRRACLW